MREPKKIHKYSAKEYLAIEEAAEYRSEFVDGEIFAMAGASPAHGMVYLLSSGMLMSCSL